MAIIEEDIYTDEVEKVERPVLNRGTEDVGESGDGKPEDEVVEERSYTLSADEFGDDLEIEGDDIREMDSDSDEELGYDGGSSGKIGGDMELDDSDGDMDSLYSPDERLSMLADQLMSACVNKWGITKDVLAKMLRMPSPKIFRNENYILFSVLMHYRGRLNYIDIDAEFIKLFLNRNRKILIEAKDFIDIGAYGEVDGSEELGYIAGVIKHYNRLCTFKELTETEFETVFEKYLIEFKALEMGKVLQQAKVILTDGLKVGRNKLFGFDDSENYIKKRSAEIRGLVALESGSGFVNMRDMSSDTNVVQSYKVGNFGRLEALNKLYGGIYTGMMYSFIAPPKAGKSKLCARLVHEAVVHFGTNVTVIAAEGGKDAFFAELRAIHFDYIYNTGVDVSEKRYGVSQDAILHDKFPSDELKQLEASSKFDLVTNEDYGSVEFIDKPFVVENFIEDIDTSIKSNNSTMIVCDYLQYITSSDSRKSEREYTSEAYKLALTLSRTRNVAFITPAQYKQEAFDRLLASKDSDNVEMRTSGGSTSEAIRTPDILEAIFATTQDIINQRIKLLSIPSRFCRPHPPIDVAINYETCQFISLDDE
jgi:archaellum biogenesis ATPase FlaH